MAENAKFENLNLSIELRYFNYVFWIFFNFMWLILSKTVIMYPIILKIKFLQQLCDIIFPPNV